MLNRFNHNNRVVDHQTDGQDQPEKRKGVYRKSEEGKKRKSADRYTEAVGSG